MAEYSSVAGRYFNFRSVQTHRKRLKGLEKFFIPFKVLGAQGQGKKGEFPTSKYILYE